MENLIEFIVKYRDIFTVFGIIGTLIISLISLYFSFKNNKTIHYINAITKSRIEWIQDLRDSIADFIAHTNIFFNAYYKNNFDKSGEHLSKCKQIGSKITLLLNCCDDKDIKIITLINEILDNYYNYYDQMHNCKVVDGFFKETPEMKKYKDLTERKIKELTIKVQIYLKTEWNRVKYESNGKKYEKETEEFDYFELKSKIENTDYTNKKWKRFWINTRAKTIRIITSPKLISIFIVSLIFFVIIYLKQKT